MTILLSIGSLKELASRLRLRSSPKPARRSEHPASDPNVLPGILSPCSLLELPPEIVDYIISHLRNERYALLSASAAHRSLRPLCLHYLLEVLVVNLNTFKYSKLKAALKASPQLPAYTRSLALMGAGDKTVREQDIELFVQFTSVTSLHLQLVVFDDALGFQSLLRRLPCLQTLSIKGFIGIKTHIWDLPVVPEGPTLRSISLDKKVLSDAEEAVRYCDNRFNILMQWLAQTHTKHSLEKVTLRCLTGSEITLAQRVLDWETNTLNELTFILTGMSYQTFMTNHFLRLSSSPLTSNSPISVLGVSVDITKNAVPVAMALLYHVKIPSLRTVKITFTGHWNHGLSKWTSVKIPLATADEPRFDPVILPALEQVKLVFHQVSVVRNAEELLERFALASRRGVQVSFSPEAFRPSNGETVM